MTGATSLGHCMSHVRHRGWKFGWLLMLWSLVFAGAACGDAAIMSNTSLDETREADTGSAAPRLSDEFFMVAGGEQQLRANVTDAVDLKVFLYVKRSGEPAANQRVEYEILDSRSGQATLAARQATTGAAGDAKVQLRLGAVEDTVRVRAKNASSNGVDFTINVLPLATGNLRVTLTNTAPSIMDLVDIDVRLYRHEEFSCDDFRPLETPLVPPVLEQRAARAGDAVVFESLGTLQRFVATAVARGNRGQIAAGGCSDDIRIEGERTKELELPLMFVPLNPVGRYDVNSRWDFTQALTDSGPVGATVMRVLNVFENPGLALYTEIINLVNAAFGGIISGTIALFLDVTNLDRMFQDLINNFIEGNDVLRRVRDAGRDLRDVVAKLHIHSDLTIGKLSSNYEFIGRDNWLGITLYWRWNCPANAPADCGAINLVPDRNGDFAQLGVLSSEWNGRVVAYNKLQIDRHSVSLRYGRLIIYVLNEVILPALTDGNAHSMSEAFAYWIGCARLADALLPSGEACALGACVYDHQIESFCTTAVSTVFGFADMLVRNLEFDMGLHLGGEGVLVELDSDGFVDRIEEGQFTGTVETPDGRGSTPFTATWTAERIDFNPL